MKEECNLLLTTLGEVELRVFGWILGKRKKLRSSCLALHGDHRAQIQTVLFIVNVMTKMLVVVRARYRVRVYARICVLLTYNNEGNE